MREVKFRVRGRKTKVVLGYETLMPDITNDGWQWAKSSVGIDWESGTYQNDYYIREQYTGLKDKNGKEIFEGDIVHLHESIDYNAEQRRILGEKADWINLDGLCVVEWDDEGADFQMSNKEICRGFGSRGQQEIEIIGNIYENSDLIV